MNVRSAQTPVQLPLLLKGRPHSIHLFPRSTAVATSPAGEAGRKDGSAPDEPQLSPTQTTRRPTHPHTHRGATRSRLGITTTDPTMRAFDSFATTGAALLALLVIVGLLSTAHAQSIVGQVTVSVGGMTAGGAGYAKGNAYYCINTGAFKIATGNENGPSSTAPTEINYVTWTDTGSCYDGVVSRLLCEDDSPAPLLAAIERAWTSAQSRFLSCTTRGRWTRTDSVIGCSLETAVPSWRRRTATPAAPTWCVGAQS